jgi:hypothetical protein
VWAHDKFDELMKLEVFTCLAAVSQLTLSPLTSALLLCRNQIPDRMVRDEGGEEGAAADGVVETVNLEVGMETVGVVVGESRRTGRSRTTMGLMMGTEPTPSLVYAWVMPMHSNNSINSHNNISSNNNTNS